MIRASAAVLSISSSILVHACPYLDSLNKNSEESRSLRSVHPYSSPTEALETDIQAPVITSSKADICFAYKSLKTEYLKRLPSDELGKSNAVGKIVRLTFHDAGEYDSRSSDKLGMDGCMSSSSSNNGLIEWGGIVDTFVSPLYTFLLNKGAKISRADFHVMIGKIAIEDASGKLFYNIPFHYGRRDNLVCEGGNGRLPGAQQPQVEFNRVFVSQMGLTIADAVTLLGAHTVGHVHPEFSGYGKAGSDLSNAKNNAMDETPAIFDNDYYKVNIEEPWINQKLSSDQNQWLVGEPNHPDIIFTNADMFIAFPIDLTGSASTGINNQLCKSEQVRKCGLFGLFCSMVTSYRCDPSNKTGPTTIDQVKKYADDNNAFLKDFAVVYKKMTTRGYGISDYEFITPSAGKLGTLKTTDLSKC